MYNYRDVIAEDITHYINDNIIPIVNDMAISVKERYSKISRHIR